MTPVISNFERFFLKSIGLVHGVKGRLEHPMIAEEQIMLAKNRGRTRARGSSASGRRWAWMDGLRSRVAGKPRNPSFRVYKQDAGLTMDLVEMPEVKSVAELQSLDPSFPCVKQ
jgi:hypothetical protein